MPVKGFIEDVLSDILQVKVYDIQLEFNSNSTYKYGEVLTATQTIFLKFSSPSDLFKEFTEHRNYDGLIMTSRHGEADIYFSKWVFHYTATLLYGESTDRVLNALAFKPTKKESKMYKWVDHSSGSYYVQVSNNEIMQELTYCFPSVYCLRDEVAVDADFCGKFLGVEAAKKAVEEYYA